MRAENTKQKNFAVLEYNWEVLTGDASAMSSFVIDKKNLATHQECYIVETCKFFPYPEGGKWENLVISL
jgi:hypothetical protein